MRGQIVPGQRSNRRQERAVAGAALFQQLECSATVDGAVLRRRIDLIGIVVEYEWVFNAEHFLGGGGLMRLQQV